MKLLTLYTQSYEQMLRAFFTEVEALGLTLHSEQQQEALFSCCYAYDRLDPKALDTLACLLEQIAIQENPVYRYSEKLTRLALDLRNTSVHTEHLRCLRQYLRENRMLHLEGYVLFRMSDFRGQLDRMIFSLIKKLKLTEQ